MNGNYTLATYKGAVLLDLNMVESIRRSKRPPATGGVTLIVKPKGGNHVNAMHLDTGSNEAHALIEHFNNHFKKEPKMNPSAAKVSDYIDLTDNGGTEVRLYAQDIMNAKLEAGDDEDTTNLSVIMQNGRSRAWTIGNAAAHDFAAWANSQSAVLKPAHEEGRSVWTPRPAEGKETGRAALNALHNENMSDQMMRVYGAVEDRLGVLFNMGHGENLFKSNEFRKDFVKALTLSIGTIARAVALEECTTLHDHMLTEHGLGEKQDDTTDAEDVLAALDKKAMAKFFSDKLGVPVEEVNVIRIDGNDTPDHMIDALRQAFTKPDFIDQMEGVLKPGGQRVPMGLLPQNALEALKDVMSHRDDFLRAIRTQLAICTANGDDGDAEYWKHQEKVLMRMDSQARAAVKAHERVPS